MWLKGTELSFREGIGLFLAVVGAALVPLGWIISAKILVVAGILFGVGAVLFYSQRRIKREEEIEKESSGGGGTGHAVPKDIHNYTGWRSGGRRDDFESTSGSSGGDSD